MERLAAALRSSGVTLAIDVGANEGQFGVQLLEAGYGGRILSFEPAESAHTVLAEVARQYPNWHVGPPLAIGDREGEIEIYLSANSVSTSTLRMLGRHLEAAPESRPIAVHRVPLSTLDEAVLSQISEGDVPFLKIDVQGAERSVLGGARRLLPKVEIMQLELSLVPLYEGQWLFDEAYAALRGAGFRLADAHAAFFDPESGQLLQMDGLFLREATAIG